MADTQGLIARVTSALRYAATGTAPAAWFGPSQPMAVQAPLSVVGRQFDYPVAINLNYTPRAGEPASFAKLRNLADACAPLRMVIERQKDLITGLDWRIKARSGKLGRNSASDPSVDRIHGFFEAPDGKRDWSQWIRAILEDNMVIDATTIYARKTRGGDLFALEIIDGATIKPLIGADGRTPDPGEPAYQQVLKGMPAVDYTTDELLYYPQNFRANKLYGYSRVEQIITIAEQSIARMKSQLASFTHGNIGDGYFTAPENYQPVQIDAIEKAWNSLMLATEAGGHQSLFLPHGVDWHATKTDVMADTFDEWLVRLVCFPFGVSPTPFMKQTGLGHGSAQSDQQAAMEGGIAPLMQYVQRLMNRVLVQWFERPDLEFSWVEDREFDPAVAAQIDDLRLKNGSRTINDVKDRNGEPAIEGGDVPLLFSGSTWVTLESVINPPPPLHAAVPATGDSGAPALINPDGGSRLSVPGEAPAMEETNAGTGNSAAFAKADASAEARLMRALAKYLTRKAEEIAPILGDALGLAKAAPMDDQSGKIDAALDDTDWDWSDLSDIVSPLLVGIAVPAGADAISELGLFDAATLKLVTKRATEYAENRAAELVGMKRVNGELVVNPDATWSISETTRKAIRSDIADAMADGKSNAQLAKAIRESTTFSAQRADTIARTETALADIRGAAAGWIESGVVGGARFDASPDCCEECQAEDGTIVELAEPDDLDLPHQNCRCSFSAILTDDMPDDSGAD